LSSAKIVVAGGPGGAMFVGAITQADPLVCHDLPEQRGEPVTITFGQVRLDPELVLHLFCTPEPAGFGHTWDDVVRGAIGAVVLVDPREPADPAATGYFEEHGVPYVLAVTDPDGVGAALESAELWRAARTGAPVVDCDTRDRGRARDALVALVEHARGRQAA
jgi:signal recognition particle receptor subunit beta